MLYKLSKMKQAMISQMSRTDITANNLSNLNTNGYKKDVTFLKVLQDEYQTDSKVSQSTDFTQGYLKDTGNPLDVGISGKGFFTVETDSGLAYTRDGHFKIDDEGVLRTSSGHAVLGQNGWISMLSDELVPGEVTITLEGHIYSNGQFIDTLRLTDFESVNDLRKIGDNLFLAGEKSLEIEPAGFEIQQGFLESSNVNPAQEMMELIDIQRQFESTQRMVQALDEVYKTAVNQVGSYR